MMHVYFLSLWSLIFPTCTAFFKHDPFCCIKEILRSYLTLMHVLSTGIDVMQQKSTHWITSVQEKSYIVLYFGKTMIMSFGQTPTVLSPLFQRISLCRENLLDGSIFPNSMVEFGLLLLQTVPKGLVCSLEELYSCMRSKSHEVVLAPLPAERPA